MNWRVLIVIAAYLLSGVGGLPLMIMGAITILFNEPFGVVKIYPFIWLFAWVAHIRMSIAWIRNRPISRRWPYWGTVAGIVSLATPLLAVLGDHPEPLAHYIGSALISTAVVSVYLLPCILLAIHLVRFHWLAADALNEGDIQRSPGQAFSDDVTQPKRRPASKTALQ